MATQKDLYSDIKLLPVLDNVRITDNTAQVGDIIDTQGYGSLVLAVQTGVLADAAFTIAALVEEGDDASLSDNTAVPDERLQGTEALLGLTQADDGVVQKIGVLANKRYVRLTLTPADNTGNGDISAFAILGHAAVAPMKQA